MPGHVPRDKFGTPLQDGGLSVALGSWPGVDPIHKFFGGTISGTVTTVCDTRSNSIYQWLDPSSAGAVTLQSTDDGDQPGGGGLEVLHVFGLNTSYDLQDELVILDGVGQVTTANDNYIHVWRMHGEPQNGGFDVNSVQELGDISASIAGLELAKVHQGLGQTLMSPFIIPRGYSGLTQFGKISVPKGQSVNGSFRIRETTMSGSDTPLYGPQRVAHEFNPFQQAYDYPFANPVRLSERTRTEVVANTDGGGAFRVSGGYDITLWPLDFSSGA